MNPFNLKDKLVLVTGSTQGIGKAAAQSFIAAGATVLINGRKKDVVQSVVAEFNANLGDGGGKALPATADAVTMDGINALQSIIADVGKPLDVLVHNVGIFGVRDFFEMGDEEWENIFNMNVMSTVRVCRVFLKEFLDRNSGRIVVVSSEAGIRGFPTMAHYAMTKSAQLSLVRSMAGLTRGTDVRVNAIAPGPTWTEGVEVYMQGVAAKNGTSLDIACAEYFKKDEPTSLIERFLQADEIGNAIVFLSSPASHGMNGTTMRVEGGMVQAIY